jgi:glycosyltransferase involved in cell wall biosynthesis
VESKLSKKERIIEFRYSKNKQKNNTIITKKSLVIAWAPHSVRAEKIAHSLNSKIFIKGCQSKAKILSLIKYIKLSINTMKVLQKEKPDVIICQLPPIFLAYSILVYKFLTFSTKPDIILDLHSASFFKPWTYFGFMNKYLYKKSKQLIITNKQLITVIDSKYKNKVLILEDAIFDIPKTKNKTNTTTVSQLSYTSDYDNDRCFKVGIICSFAPDEPISEIIATAKQIPDVKFFITGDHNRINNKILNNDSNTENLHYTGFLEYDDYIKLISSMDALIALTKRNKTLLSGCSEAIMLEKPLITSNFEVLQKSYNKGTVFVDNSVPQIVNAITKVRKNYWKLKKEIKYLKEEKDNEWNMKINIIKTMI